MGLTMLMTMIKSLIFIPLYLLLSGCGEYINIYLDNKFPVNMNNDGKKSRFIQLFHLKNSSGSDWYLYVK